MKLTVGTLALFIVAVAAAPVNAQPASGDQTSSDSMKASPEGAASTLEFEKSNQKMHEGMMLSFTGDADVDFVTGMIPHHQGAIDMAKIELKYGKDPEIRKLAEEIVKAQEEEISLMNAWLAKRKGNQEAQPPSGHSAH